MNSVEMSKREESQVCGEGRLGGRGGGWGGSGNKLVY